MLGRGVGVGGQPGLLGQLSLGCHLIAGSALLDVQYICWPVTQISLLSTSIIKRCTPPLQKKGFCFIPVILDTNTKEAQVLQELQL